MVRGPTACADPQPAANTATMAMATKRRMVMAISPSQAERD
jgi:hypothetical protein